MNEISEKSQKPKPKLTIHHVLAHSYAVYFLAFIIGVMLDWYFPTPLFTVAQPWIGVIILLVGTILVLWAQTTSRRTHPLRNAEETKDDIAHFKSGPYRYLRSPTHWGLAFLLLSYGFLVNELISTVIALVTFFITRIIFVRKEEQMLAEKYGKPYQEYKKTVRF